MEFSDDILSVEYEYFSCGFDVNVSLDVDLYAEYESFSFDSVQADFLFEYCKSNIVKSNNVVIKNSDLSQTLVMFNVTRLVNFLPTILPRLLIHFDIISSQLPQYWLVLSMFISFLIGLNYLIS